MIAGITLTELVFAIVGLGATLAAVAGAAYLGVELARR